MIKASLLISWTGSTQPGEKSPKTPKKLGTSSATPSSLFGITGSSRPQNRLESFGTEVIFSAILSEVQAPRHRTTVWANNFICHRDVFQGLVAFWRRGFHTLYAK